MVYNMPLIIYTDEVGSTFRDTTLTTKEEILGPRVDLFGAHLCCLPSEDGKKKEWRILKSVGDQLILTFNGNSDSVVDAVLCLFNAWKERIVAESTIRVAVHRPMTVRFARGSHLLERLKEEHDDLETVWPSADSTLPDDLFGLEMNLAARLVSLPAGNAFLMSSQVLAKVSTAKLNAFEQELTDNGFLLSPLIPVSRLKGFETVFGLDGQPKEGKYSMQELWVQEILPNQKLDKHKPLIYDSKSYQKVRTIIPSCYLNEKNGSTVTAKKWGNDHRTLKKEIIDELVNHLIKQEEETGFNYHTDYLFSIEKSWKGLEPTFFRKKEDKKDKKTKWLSVNNVSEEIMYLLFTSCFGENVDELLDRKIREEEIIKQWNVNRDISANGYLLSESQVINKRAHWVASENETGHSDACQYFYLDFQFKDSVGAADNFIHYTYLKEGLLLENMNLELLACGMLKGKADGFIIFKVHSYENLTDNNIVEVIDKTCRKVPDESFFTRLLPLILHKISMKWMQNRKSLIDVISHKKIDDWLYEVDSRFGSTSDSEKCSSE